MGDLSKDEIRSTLHVDRELNDEFLKAYEKKTGKKFKKKSAYTEALRKYVEEVNQNDVADNVDTETPTQSTAIVTSDSMTVEDKEVIAKKLAEERKKQQLIANPPTPFPQRLPTANSDDITSFLNHVPRDRKIKITRIEID